MADVWEQFFQIADADRDGKISGGEAVAFFQKSGLPQMTLAKIWQIADQGQTGFLDRREFNAALKLVTVAQSGRELTADIARMVLSGAGPQIPLPRIAGFGAPGPAPGPQQGPPPSQPQQPQFIVGSAQRPGPPSQGGPPKPQPQGGFGNDAFGAGFGAGRPAESSKPPPSTSSYGSVGSGDFASAAGSFQGGGPPSSMTRPVSAPSFETQQVGGRPVQPQAPTSFQGGFGPSALAPYSGGAPPQGPASQPRGAAFTPSATPPQSTGGVAPPQGGSYAAQPWPKMTPQDAHRYTQVFTSVDTDRDQKITGEQARDLFLSWGIPREILKQIWDLSDQDQDSMLSHREFCTALYLMEKSREGRPLPPVLPTGIHFDEPAPDPRAQIAAQQIAAAQAAIAETQHAPWSGPGTSGMLSGAGPTPPASVKTPPVEAAKPEDVAKSAFEDLGPFKPKAPKADPRVVTQLARDEQEMINGKVKTTEELDKKVWQMETDLLDAKQKTEFYRDKMQELILFENKCKNWLAEITDRVETDKREVETLAKKYDAKYKSTGETASRLQQEEALFKELQDKKLELFNAVAALEAGADPSTRVQEKVNALLGEIDALRNAAVERATKLGVHAAPPAAPGGPLVLTPAAPSQAASEGSAFGWTDGITSGAADWDEDWDNFEDEGFEIVDALRPDDPGFPLPAKVPAVTAAPNLSSANSEFQADFGTGSIPQSPSGASAVPSSPGASQSAYSPKGGHSQGAFKPPIMGISPPPTSSAKKAAQRYAGVSDSQDKADMSGQSSPSSSIDTGSEWRRPTGGFVDSDAFSDAMTSNVRASWGVNSVAASFDSAGPGNVRASQKVGGTLSRLAPPQEERGDAFGHYNASKWAEDSTPSPAAKPFKPAGLGNILSAGDDTFSEGGSGHFSPQAEKTFGSFDDGDPFNLRASANPAPSNTFAKTDAWSAFD